MPAINPQDRTKLEALAALARGRGGRVAEAELELHEWCRHDAPAAARTLLTALLARRGDIAAAREVMGDVARRSTDSLDVAETQLAISVLTLASEHDEARRLGALLLQRHGHDASVRAWLDMIDLPGLPKAAATPGEHSPDNNDNEAELLGVELSVKPGVVPSLVHAMKQRPATRPISLLRAALLHIVGDFDRRPDMPVLTQALAELALLLGDEADARRWAHRTLQIDPYNARMALLLGQVADDVAVGPTAQETLRRVSMKFPGYPDVQKAYAQRVELDRLHRERRVA